MTTSRRTRRSQRPGFVLLRALPPMTRHIARTTPWATLLAGCLAGTALLAALAYFADRSQNPLGQGTVSVTYLPAVAALAFVPRTAFVPLAHATPVPAWLPVAGQILLAVPVLAATCWLQVNLMVHTTGHAVSLPALYPLLARLIGWSALSVAAAACCDRTRYRDLGGAVAAPIGLAAIAAASVTPGVKHLLATPPATPGDATLAWYGVAATALVLTGAAMRDRWHRYARNRGRR